MIELIERWNTAQGIILYNAILHAFKNKKPLASVEGLKKHNGRWDLRGLAFPVPTVSEVPESNGAGVERTRPFTPEMATLQDIDFSYSTFFRTQWITCRFSNVLFHSADLIQTRFYGCAFDNTTFDNCDFNGCVVGGNNYSPGSIRHTHFINCNLKKTYFYDPEISDCEFDNCKIINVDFNGSRFKNCNFSGLLDNVIFRSRVPGSDSIWINRMENVDFSDAVLLDCVFGNELPLDLCRLPHKDHLVIRRDRTRFFEEARDIISSFWEGEDRDRALDLFNNVYLVPDKTDKDIEVLYRATDAEAGFSERFFDCLMGIYSAKK